MKYPRITTVYERPAHEETAPAQSLPILSVQWTENGPEERFCGYSWCNGKCNLPALVIPIEDSREMKAYSSMVACGALMQWFRVEWKGARIEVPQEHRADFERRYWL